MSEAFQAEILSVGTELTEGVIQNSHFRFLGAELKSLGFTVVRGLQIPDDRALFAGELGGAMRGNRLVVITGGLGPTSDDLTREVVAAAAGVELSFREDLWSEIAGRFRGLRISETNRKQACIPEGFQAVANPLGTAPGFIGRISSCWIVALPGPPRELEPMFLERVIPRLREAFGLEPALDLKASVFLVPESSLEEILQKGKVPGVEWGTRFTEDRIVVTFRGGSTADRGLALDRLREALDPIQLREGDVRPAEVLVRELDKRHLRLALAESCTGGWLGKLLTDIPGSSRVFWGSLVVYANEAKELLLGVAAEILEKEGAVSQAAAEAMAAGLLSRTGVDVAAAITGIAGPEGGSADKPVGTIWIAVRDRKGVGTVRSFRFRGSREMVRLRSAVAAMLMVQAGIEAGRSLRLSDGHGPRPRNS